MIDEIDKSKILEIFTRHCEKVKQLKGEQYQACCPFHDDKNPSLHFHLNGGLYHCKSCLAEGNIVMFCKAFNEDFSPFISNSYKNGSTLSNNSQSKYYNNDNQSLPSENIPFLSKNDELELDEFIEEHHRAFLENPPFQILPIHKGMKVGLHKSGRLGFPYFNYEGSPLGYKWHKHPITEEKGWVEKRWHTKVKWYGIQFIASYNKDIDLIICEGEPDFLTLKYAGYQVISPSFGCGNVPPLYDELGQFNIVMLFDNDSSGSNGAMKFAEKLFNKFGNDVKIAQWDKTLPKCFDPTDDYSNNKSLFYTEKALKNSIPYKTKEIVKVNKSKTKQEYNVVKVIDAVDMNIKKPNMIVEDILNVRGNTMLAAEDNVGKSMMANQLGLCIATGIDFLGYKVPRPLKVLLVQHEMENGEQIDRLKKQYHHYYFKSPELVTENLLMHLIDDDENLSTTDQFDVINNTLEKNPEIEVVIFDNIGQSTNVPMSNPDEIRNELKRLKAICRKHSVAFILVAHLVKVDWNKVMDLLKTQIQGGKPITDWADNVIQLHTSSCNSSLVLFKITKIKSVHDEDGLTTKLLNQGVWFNKNKDLLFTRRFTISHWEAHFKSTDKYERELEFVTQLSEYPQPFTTQDAMNVGEKLSIPISPSTVKSQWLKKLCRWTWLIKEGHGKYSVNIEAFDLPNSHTVNF